jgi:LacI family transcriptional regulator
MAARVSARRVTLADVATAAGVSPTTASFVLSGRSRQMRISHDVEGRVRQAASDLQYRPNSVSVSLRKGITHTIGFISDTVATTPYAGTLIKGALEAARERGNLLLIGETEGDPELERRLIQTMHDRRADGLILTTMYTRAIRVPKALLGTPAVLLNALPDRPAAITSVIPDEIQAGRDAATALLRAGHRDGIYLIGAGPGQGQLPPDSVAAAERLAGISEALAAAGTRFAGASGCLDWEPEDGYRATQAVLAAARAQARPGARAQARQQALPQALICFNDRLALGAYQALGDYGLRVPADVSVISFDDDPIASWIKPRLTTLAIPHYDLGRQAVDALFGASDRPQANPAAEIRRVPMPLRERDSIRVIGMSAGEEQRGPSS